MSSFLGSFFLPLSYISASWRLLALSRLTGRLLLLGLAAAITTIDLGAGSSGDQVAVGLYTKYLYSTKNPNILQ